jgi:hypothetical protein
VKDEGFQGPTNGATARSYGELFGIVTHPAFRIGFLDAQSGKPLDHDRIAARVFAETPSRAFIRMGWDPIVLEKPEAVELAQYRYEEGRFCVVDLGLRCKAWGHPDFPPAKLREYIWQRAEKAAQSIVPEGSIVAALRCSDAGPLFAAVSA